MSVNVFNVFYCEINVILRYAYHCLTVYNVTTQARHNLVFPTDLDCDINLLSP